MIRSSLLFFVSCSLLFCVVLFGVRCSLFARCYSVNVINSYLRFPYGLLVVGGLLFVIMWLWFSDCCLLCVVCCLLFVACCLMRVCCCVLCVGCSLFLVGCCSLFVVCCLLIIVRWLLCVV